MTVVDRSLSVLKEIQEQLQSSKLQSASYRAGGYSVAGQEPLSRNKIKVNSLFFIAKTTLN